MNVDTMNTKATVSFTFSGSQIVVFRVYVHVYRTIEWVASSEADDTENGNKQKVIGPSQSSPPETGARLDVSLVKVIKDFEYHR